MKKEELTALGITDEQAEKVLEMHGKEQNEAASKLSEAENKLARCGSDRRKRNAQRYYGRHRQFR